MCRALVEIHQDDHWIEPEITHHIEHANAAKLKKTKKEERLYIIIRKCPHLST